MRVLYVGFKGQNNTSCRLVSLLKGEKLFLTNSFAGLARDIANMPTVDSEVYLFGLDKDLIDAVRIESCAEQNGQCLQSKLLLTQIAENLRANEVSCGISNKPTRYLCNDAYYRILEKTEGRAVLIHIPGAKHITDALIAGIIKSLEDRG